MYFINKQLREEHGVDFAAVACDKNIDEPCVLSPEYTWHKKSEAERIFLVKGDDRGRPAWYYVLVVDDDEKMRLFIEKMQKTNVVESSIDLTNYGQVLHCKNIWVTSTIFWSSQLHACCVRDTLQTSKGCFQIESKRVIEKLLPQLRSSYRKPWLHS